MHTFRILAGMATKKTPQSKAGKAPATTKLDEAAPADGAPEQYDPSTDRATLGVLLARRGQIDDAHREAFDELISDEDRARLGIQTKAQGALHDAVAWAVQMDKAFTEYPAIVSQHYSPERFQYYLDRTAALAELVTAESNRRGAGRGTRTTAEQREKAAREKRETLIDALKGFAGERRAEKEALAAATGQTGTAELLGTSIANLAALGRKWLARKDAKAVIQAKSAGLTAALVTDTLKAARALTDAASTAQLAGRLPATDSPEVNLIEGTVLHEMGEAERCFRNIRKKTLLVGRLVPGTATRHVFGAKKGSSEPVTDGAGAPAAPQPA